MSTIAWDGQTLAADSRAYGGRYMSSPGSKAKIRRLDDGTRLGCVSSDVGASEQVMDWYAAGCAAFGESDRPTNFGLIVVTPDGKLMIANDRFALSGPIDCARYAIGSGGDYALGAMAMGATAVQAVLIAAELDPHSGAPVLSLDR